MKTEISNQKLGLVRIILGLGQRKKEKLSYVFDEDLGVNGFGDADRHEELHGESKRLAEVLVSGIHDDSTLWKETADMRCVGVALFAATPPPSYDLSPQ